MGVIVPATAICEMGVFDFELLLKKQTNKSGLY